ncbi:MAG: phage integrase N-terminal SAM-like domain-containing protein [Pseudotabrizicola sp.]|nr:phage integrase N-terminal SAM-like domain-containing protein [Pseudotabrizicola sp.]MDO8883677.1 phage integrase N-terminal SAM-like domain-containing protein [Pseudotabrizicola sp.]
MTEQRVSPPRQRMIEDMRIRGMGDKAQKSHIRAIKDFAAFLGRSPDTATPEDLRAHQSVEGRRCAVDPGWRLVPRRGRLDKVKPPSEPFNKPIFVDSHQ